jgi:hypothetical protein
MSLIVKKRSINAKIAEVQAKDVVFPAIDNIELIDWITINQFARFWYCEDIHHSSILRQAIIKAINKSTDHLLSIFFLKITPMIKKFSFLGLYHPTPRAIL